MNEIKDKSYEVERSLYGIKDTKVYNCRFEGKVDGESPLKETKNIIVDNCYFDLRYPLWHMMDSEILNSNLTINARAPFWYSKNTVIKNTTVLAVKMLRECSNIKIYDSKFDSIEFGWKSNNIEIHNSEILNSPYVFLDSNNIVLDNVKFTGKYSFQYMNNLTITNSNLDTKDAFWHSKNVTVINSIVKGEYLAWYSKNITFINCEIIGTQPFCYSKNIKVINSKMIDTDLCFEHSTIDIESTTPIKSIKNPISGKIVAPKILDTIYDEFKKKGKVKIITKE